MIKSMGEDNGINRCLEVFTVHSTDQYENVVKKIKLMAEGLSPEVKGCWDKEEDRNHKK